MVNFEQVNVGWVRLILLVMEQNVFFSPIGAF